MVLRALEPGFVDDVSEVLETFISEGGRQGPILVAEIVVEELAAQEFGDARTIERCAAHRVEFCGKHLSIG